MRRRLFAAALAALVAAVALAAGAPWYERYRRGVELEQAGSWVSAIAEFRAAAAVERTPKKRVHTYGQNYLFDYDPHFHLARCLTEAGRYREAGIHLGVAMRAGVTPREQLAPIEQRLAAVRETRAAPTPPAAGRLVVESTPAGARVVIDGAGAGTAPLGPLALPAGAHTVRLELAGHAVEERAVDVEAGGTYTLAVTLLPATAALPSPAAVAPLPTPTSPAATRGAVPAPSGAASHGNQSYRSGSQARTQVAREARQGRGPARLGVRTACCSGMAYVLEFVDSVQPDEMAFESHGIQLVVDPKSLVYLDGTVLDYTREGLNQGFKFENPDVKAECGCGESFTV